jgi:hypothetical protein
MNISTRLKEGLLNLQDEVSKIENFEDDIELQFDDILVLVSHIDNNAGGINLGNQGGAGVITVPVFHNGAAWIVG